MINLVELNERFMLLHTVALTTDIGVDIRPNTSLKRAESSIQKNLETTTREHPDAEVVQKQSRAVQRRMRSAFI